jgi:hypothetical protein
VSVPWKRFQKDSKKIQKIEKRLKSCEKIDFWRGFDEIAELAVP